MLAFFSQFLGSCHKALCSVLQLFDITTTVDPSYIISLIRKLLPANVKCGEISLGYDAHDASTEGPKTEAFRITSSPTENGDKRSPIHVSETMKTAENFVEQSVDGKLYFQNKHEDVAVREEDWEESGCILWDLAASRTHAEFMVIGTSACHVVFFFFDLPLAGGRSGL